jgi:hypothetical protein
MDNATLNALLTRYLREMRVRLDRQRRIAGGECMPRVPTKISTALIVDANKQPGAPPSSKRPPEFVMLLAEPEIQLVMAADRVDEHALRPVAKQPNIASFATSPNNRPLSLCPMMMLWRFTLEYWACISVRSSARRNGMTCRMMANTTWAM